MCAHGDTPDKQIETAAQQMMNAGIKVYYYNLKKGSVLGHAFTWDFMRIQETQLAVIWDSFATVPNSVIDEAIYSRHSEYKDFDLAQLYIEIRNRSIELSLSHAVAGPAISTP